MLDVTTADGPFLKKLRTPSLLRGISFREDRNSVTPARFGRILVSLIDSAGSGEDASALLKHVAAAVVEIFEGTVELAANLRVAGVTHTIELSDRWDGVAHPALCIPVRVDRAEIGVLELHAAQPYAFDHAGVDLVSVIAHTVGCAISEHTKLVDARDAERGLRDAFVRRAPIEQAKGILMALRQISGDAAFAVLSQRSQLTNTKLAVVAAELVVAASARQPDPPPLED